MKVINSEEKGSPLFRSREVELLSSFKRDQVRYLVVIRALVSH